MTEGSTNERTNKRTNEHTNIRTDERKDENYIPLGINAGGIIRSLFEHSSCDINTLLDDPASYKQLLLDACHPDIGITSYTTEFLSDLTTIVIFKGAHIQNSLGKDKNLISVKESEST